MPQTGLPWTGLPRMAPRFHSAFFDMSVPSYDCSSFDQYPSMLVPK